MLRINVSRNGKAAAAYFDKGLSQQDYYLDKKNIPGKWHGKTALMLGLRGEVNKESFEALAHNRHPKTGEKLSVRDTPNRRAGVDFTFSANKDISILYALTNDRDILTAHQNAVRAAMHEVEADMQSRITKNGKTNYATPGNIAYAAFDHFTTRPVCIEKGKPLEADPQLHTHCFIFNVSYVREKNRFQAIEQVNVHRNAEYYEALYHSKLTQEMKNAGYAVERSGKFWKVKGFDRSLINKFSNRSLDIKEEIKQTEKKENVQLTVKQKAAFGALTRKNKNKLKSTDNLKQIWENRLTPDEHRIVFTAKGQGNKEKVKQETLTPAMAIQRALNHHLERKSTVSQKKVLAYALRQSYGIHSADEVKAAFAAKRQDLIIAQKGGIDILTTKEMLHHENKMIAYARESKNKAAPINPDYAFKQDFLNSQQQTAIKNILSSTDNVMILSGAAGGGKSTLLSEVKTGIEEKGKQIFAFAPSSEASRTNLREKGFKAADTIERFLIDKNMQAQTKGQFIVIDEAGMVGTRKMNEIFQVARTQKARVLLSGDWRQHSAVNAGDALRQLEEKAGLKVARVKEIVRQRNNPAYKQAITALAHGDTRAGFKQLDKLGCIKEITDTEQRHKMIADDYVQSVSAKRSAIVVSPTHAEGNKISAAIRGKLREKERLSGIERQFDIQRPLSFTEAQRQDANVYEKGMAVQFHQNVKGGFKAGDKYDVIEQKDGTVRVRNNKSGEEKSLNLNEARRFQVYRKDKIGVSTGEIIRITTNGRTRENNRINNGQSYQVKGFTPEGHIKLSNGKTLDKSYGNFQYGYARTSHAVQGRDAEVVIIAQSAISFPASNEKQFYVSASRGVKTCRIYTDAKEELQKAVMRSGERAAAKEIQELATRQQRQRFYTKQIKKNFDYGKNTQKHKGVISPVRKFKR